MELSAEPRALSDLVGTPVEDGSGRKLGRVWELRGRREGAAVVIDELLIGRGGLLRRLRGPGPEARGIPWAAVIEIGERRIVVRT